MIRMLFVGYCYGIRFERKLSAELLDPVRRYAWRRWKFDWLTPKKPGKYMLLSRAKDAGGALQPDKHDQNYGVYVINHSLPIEVFVDGSERLRS